ncbi:hypothetical protein DRQ33_04605 [bacterium]|nr:MAG: hypothetical protein DRQ33_04605 [bacterium]
MKYAKVRAILIVIILLDLWLVLGEYPVLNNRPRISLTDSNGRINSLADIRSVDDLYIGPEPETLLVDSYMEQDGDIIVYGDGVLIIDDAELALRGILWQQDNGKVIVRNGAYLNVFQEYLSQFPHFMNDNSYFEAENCTIYAHTVYRTFLYDSSTYIARRVYFPFWNFRQCFDQSTLIMENANMVGDFLIRDSCYVEMNRCDTLLPWFCAALPVSP